MTNSPACARRPPLIPAALWTAVVLAWVTQSLLVTLNPGPCGQVSCTGSLTAHDVTGYLIAGVVWVASLSLIVGRTRSTRAIPADVAPDLLVDITGAMSKGRLRLFLSPSLTTGQGSAETQTGAAGGDGQETTIR